MEIRAFAEAVLFSSDLDTKLFAPAQLTDFEPGKATDVPDAPGRPVDLPLVSSLAVPVAPTPRSIEDERIRGQALPCHFGPWS